MKARRVKGLDCDGTLATNARRVALVRLDELFSFDPAIRDPKAVEPLHDMRIAAKRLRYVLELTAPALGPGARVGAREAKALQGLLGEIHDCDVMLPLARRHAKRLREQDLAAVRDSVGSRAKDLDPEAVRRAPNLGRYRGLEALATYLIARREVLYARFIGDWDRLLTKDFRGRVEAGLEQSESDDAAGSDRGEPGGQDGTGTAAGRSPAAAGRPG